MVLGEFDFWEKAMALCAVLSSAGIVYGIFNHTFMAFILPFIVFWFCFGAQLLKERKKGVK